MLGMGSRGRHTVLVVAGLLLVTGCTTPETPNTAVCNTYAGVVDGALDAMHGLRDGGASVEEVKLATTQLNAWLESSPSNAGSSVGAAIKATATTDEASLRASALAAAAKCSAAGAPISIH